VGGAGKPISVDFPLPGPDLELEECAHALGCELQSVPNNWGRPHRTLPVGAFLLSSWSSAAAALAIWMQYHARRSREVKNLFSRARRCALDGVWRSTALIRLPSGPHAGNQLFTRPRTPPSDTSSSVVRRGAITVASAPRRHTRAMDLPTRTGEFEPASEPTPADVPVAENVVTVENVVAGADQAAAQARPSMIAAIRGDHCSACGAAMASR